MIVYEAGGEDPEAIAYSFLLDPSLGEKEEAEFRYHFVRHVAGSYLGLLAVQAVPPASSDFLPALTFDQPYVAVEDKKVFESIVQQAPRGMDERKRITLEEAVAGRLSVEALLGEAASSQLITCIGDEETWVAKNGMAAYPPRTKWRDGFVPAPDDPTLTEMHFATLPLSAVNEATRQGFTRTGRQYHFDGPVITGATEWAGVTDEEEEFIPKLELKRRNFHPQ